MTESILGIDIGGTKIGLCIGDATGRLQKRQRLVTAELDGPEAACDAMAAGLAALGADACPEAEVGVAAPGPLSSRTGRFLNPPNMPGWHDFPIRDALESRLCRKVHLMNDANAAAHAEWRFGAGRGVDTMVFLTMSTGMGAGLIVGGRLHEGADDMAGEVGHLRLAADGPVGFGRRGSLEGFCSGPGIRQLAVTKLIQARHDERPSLLFDIGRDFRLVDMPEIGAAARSGDLVALDVFREVGERLGGFLAWVADLLNPDLVVVGTIGRIYADLILPAARRVLDAEAHPRAAERCRLVPAALGEETGDLSALSACLARRS